MRVKRGISFDEIQGVVVLVATPALGYMRSSSKNSWKMSVVGRLGRVSSLKVAPPFVKGPISSSEEYESLAV